MDEFKKDPNQTDQTESNTASTQSAPVPEATVSGEVTQKKTSTGAMIAIGVVILAVVAGLAWTLINNPETDDQAIDFSTSAPVEPFDVSDLPEAVVVINGQEISREEYGQSYDQSVQIALQQGVDPNSVGIQEQLKEQSLDVLINTNLLTQAAVAAGFTATDEAVAAEIAALQTQLGGPETFATELENAGITQAELEEDIANQIIIDEFIQASPEWSEDFTVTEEEKQTLYAEAAAQSPEIPAFEEVEMQIEQQLLSQKQQAATQALIERLKAEGDVEILI